MVPASRHPASSTDDPRSDARPRRTERPTAAQRRYLERGLGEPGGKLPLFDVGGQEIPRKTIESCIHKGWATPWFENPVKPDWLVCRLTESGFQLLKGSTRSRQG